MNWMQRMMMGRYGGDQMGIRILILSMVINFVPFWPARIVSILLLAWAVFGCFPAILPGGAWKTKFLRVWYPVKNFFVRLFKRRPDAKTHKHFRCPKCRQELRVPRGKEKLS